jgi:hypothetical protein
MADKKVERSGRERPRTPTQKMKAALSDPGTMDMAETTHDKGRSALVDRFRDREQRWRTEQALRDREAAHGVEHAAERGAEDAADASGTAGVESPDEGGAS